MTTHHVAHGDPRHRVAVGPTGRPRGGPVVPWRRRFAEELDVRQVDRITAAYLLVAAIWIAVSGPAVVWAADRLGLPVTGLEVGKGFVFVLVTGLALRVALRRWAVRVEAAATREHEAAVRLREAEELRSAFLNGVSHELRTPLTSIIGYGETIRRLCRDDHAVELEHLSGRLIVNAERLRSLVLDLLDADALLRGIGHLTLRPTDVGALVTAVAAGRDVGERHLLLEGGRVHAEVDPPKLERVVDLLLDNAVKHTGPDAHILLSWDRDGDQVVVTVEDDGPGIPDELLPRIFEPFVQGDDAARSPNPGIGIGLTLVDQYVRLHHGTATVEPRPGGGTRITLRLPAAPASHGGEPAGTV